MAKRSMYVWKLAPIIEAEGSVQEVVRKAEFARLSALWVKIADGASAYRNVNGKTGDQFKELIDQCHHKGIAVWGWHVPRCPTEEQVKIEVANLRKICGQYSVDGLIMDAEAGEGFFHGDKKEADAYGRAMKALCADLGKSLAISSHDIPGHISGWLPKFNKIASYADLNYPQVYYGSSPSVENRLSRAEDGNSHVTIPFCPVGAAWIGDGGGCASASACAERAREFIRLVEERDYPEYSFWHWAGAPSAFWAVLNSIPAAT